MAKDKFSKKGNRRYSEDDFYRKESKKNRKAYIKDMRKEKRENCFFIPV